MNHWYKTQGRGKKHQKKKPFVPFDQSSFQLDPRNSNAQMNAISKNMIKDNPGVQVFQ